MFNLSPWPAFEPAMVSLGFCCCVYFSDFMAQSGACELARTMSVRYSRAGMEVYMASSAAARDDRIELRATKEEKRLLVAAAAQERLDVTSFIMRRVLPAAREVVDNAERIILSK